MRKDGFSRNSREKILSTVLVSSIVFSVAQPFLTADALDNIADTVSPIITISSPADNSIVSGFPTLSGTVTDTGWIAHIFVNGFSATLGSWTWSKIIYDLIGWPNIVTAVATDLTGNTGSTSIYLNRVSFPLNTNVTLLGTASAGITFATDLSATGVVRYGTGLGVLNLSATGTAFGTAHSFILSDLMPDTVYYFTVQGQGGTESPVMHFKTPTAIDTSSASWSIVATSSIYLSGSTASGMTFPMGGSLEIRSLTSSGSFLRIPLNGLAITASEGNWNRVIQAPEVTSDPVNLSLSGYAFTGTFYQVGNTDTELVFSGQSPTVTVNIGSTLGGKTIRIFRSPDRGATYTEIFSCIVTAGGDCTFTTDRLSRFAFAWSADVIPNSFGFPNVPGAGLSTPYVSAPAVMSGISGQTALSVIGGEYSINNAPFTALTGTIYPSDTVVLRVMSSAFPYTSTSVVLTVGGISGTFTVTTGSGIGNSNGKILSMDVCPKSDLSPSYYDGMCGADRSGNGTDITSTEGLFTGGSTDASLSSTVDPMDVRFTDIVGNWAEWYISKLATHGIVDNTELYRPDDRLTRAEFLKIATNTAGWVPSTIEPVSHFEDVSTDDWYAPYVSLALSKGAITGSNAKFRPNDLITRAEATKVLMTVSGTRIDELSTITFADLDLTSDLTRYVEAAKAKNIISGQEIGWQMRFHPNNPITRAEIAKVVVNAFHL